MSVTLGAAEQCRVLVLDGDLVPSLAISRSLARKGAIVEIGSHISKSLGSYSTSVSLTHEYPDPLATPDDFVQWICENTKGGRYDLVIPVTERTLVPLHRSREQLQHVKIAMPGSQSLELVLDKAKTMALADELGVPRPGGILLASLSELEEAQKTLRYPVVLKPARSIGASDNGASQLQVSYAFDAIELRAGCTHALRFGPVLLQEFFAGDGVGIELIAQGGKIAYAFEHRRVHEVPLSGGGSSLRKSEAINQQLLEASEKLIRALQWDGVAMVEFKLNPDTGEFTLMEINGRFWGSLPLAVAAGADFPAMLLDLELKGQITPSAPYRNDIYCRLLSRDLHWYEAVLRKDADSRITVIPSWGKVVREFSLLLSLRHRFDVQSWRDPLPGCVDIVRIFRTYSERIGVLLDERAFLRAQKQAWRRGEVGAAIANAKSILFMCYGNINRSALAHALVGGYAQDSGIAIHSSGFHEQADRPADSVMVEVSGSHGIDLSASRSSCVSVTDLRDSEVIFVMEKSHYDRLLTMDASVAGKVFLLGAHPGASQQAPEIEDPYGRPRERYEACFERIAEAVDHIKAVLAVRNGD